MKTRFSVCLWLFAMLTGLSGPALAQDVSPTVIDGARNIQGQGTTLDTNVIFSLSIIPSGQSTPVDTIQVLDTATISVNFTPETEDIGELAEIFLVVASPGTGFTMRDIDGNFSPWSGKVPDLVPTQEDIPLEADMDVEVFSGQLGLADSYRVFVGFRVRGNTLFFTPRALKFTITDQTNARDEAIALFESNISPNIVQSVCIACHRTGGAADGQSQHKFVFPSESDHLTINFEQFETLHAARGTEYILGKVQGQLAHGGGVQLTSSNAKFGDLQDFLVLLDQASEN